MNQHYDNLWELLQTSEQVTEAEARRLRNLAAHRGLHPLELWLTVNSDADSEHPAPREDFFEADTLAGDITIDDLTRGMRKEMACPSELASWPRYSIQAYLGSGGMGRVYRAHDPRLDRDVAIKILRDDDENTVRRFMQEAQTQARIEHDNVCRIYEVGEYKGRHYIAMQLIDGDALNLAARQMSLEQKVMVIRDVALGLHQAHRLGLIHRDIKPSNILVVRKEDRWHPYLVDFGLARITSDHGLTVTGAVLGTPYYMSPEQARGDIHALDRRTDVYGLGATLYEILADRPPFQGRSYADILLQVMQDMPRALGDDRGNIPVDVAAIVMRCLRKAPGQRYDSAKSLAEDLTRYLDGEPVNARPTTVWHRWRMKAVKHKATFTVSVVAMLLLLVALVWGGYQRWLSAEKARLARQFGRAVSDMDALTRFAMMSPPHDIRNEMAEVRRRMDVIRQRMAVEGALITGPGHYALGVGYLLLNEMEASRRALNQAWQAGYDEPEVAYALGLVYGRLYEEHRNQAMFIGDVGERERQLNLYRKQYRQPAVDYLSRVSNSALISRDYVASLLAYYDQRYAEAKAKAQLAGADRSWFYDAIVLEARILAANVLEYSLDGDNDMALEQVAKAESAYRRALDVGRSDPSVYFKLAELLVQSMWIERVSFGRDPQSTFERALRICAAGLDVHPEYTQLQSIRARVYYQRALWFQEQGEDPRGMLDMSIRDAQSALSLASRDVESMIVLGDAQRLFGDWLVSTGGDPQGQYERAINAYKQAESIQPSADLAIKVGLLHRFLADVKVNRGEKPATDFLAAELAYQRSIALEPSWNAYNNLGVLYLKRANFATQNGEPAIPHLQAAIEAYAQALSLTPEQFRPLINLGNAYRTLGERLMSTGEDPREALQKAIASYQQAIKAAPQALNLANVQDALGLTRLKLAEYKQNHGANPEPFIQEALTHFERAIDANPQYLHAYANKANALVSLAIHFSNQGKTAAAWLQQALQVCEEAMARNDNFWFVRYTQLWAYGQLVADIRQHGGDMDQVYANAIAAVERASDQRPNDAYIQGIGGEIQLEYGFWLLDQGKATAAIFQAAKARLARAVAINPENSGYQLSLGNVYRGWALMEDPTQAEIKLDQAMIIVEKLLASNPHHDEALLLKGRLQLVACRWSSSLDTCFQTAQATLQAAVTANPNLAKLVKRDLAQMRSLLDAMRN